MFENFLICPECSSVEIETTKHGDKKPFFTCQDCLYSFTVDALKNKCCKTPDLNCTSTGICRIDESFRVLETKG